MITGQASQVQKPTMRMIIDFSIGTRDYRSNVEAVLDRVQRGGFEGQIDQNIDPNKIPVLRPLELANPQSPHIFVNSGNCVAGLFASFQIGRRQRPDVESCPLPGRRIII
jgi:hypothetical protein